MKCHEPDSDRAADIRIFANGLPCPEYGLPTGVTPNDRPRTVACFIPVSDRDIITVKGEFNGTALLGTFDLLVDGSFLGDRRIEGAKTGVPKMVKRKLDILKVFNMPPPPGYKTPFAHTPVVEGDLRIRRLDQPPMNTFDVGGDFGIGTLVVNMSVSHASNESYMTKYETTVAGDWAENEEYEMNDAGVTPTHELEVVVTDKSVHQNRQSKHRRHFDEPRPGKHPWVSLVFFYRSIKAIKDNGCQPRPDDSHALEPVRQSQGDASATGSLSVQTGESPPFAQLMKPTQHAAAPAAAESNAGNKPRLFGNSLFSKLNNSPLPGKATALGSNSIFTRPAAPTPRPFTLPNPGDEESMPVTTSFSGGTQHESEFEEITKRQLKPNATGLNGMAQASQPIDPNDAASPSTEQARPSEAAPMTIASRPRTAKVKSEPIEEDWPSESNEAADKRNGRLSSAASTTIPASLTTNKPSLAPRHQSSIFANMGKATHVPSSTTRPPSHKALLTATHLTARAASSTIHKPSAKNYHSSAPTSPLGTPAPSQGRKHSLSPYIDSPGSAKKPRINDRKAALLAQYEAKVRRNAAAKQAVEEQRRLREEAARKREEEKRRQEEEEAEENAELERLIAAQDEEFEGLQEAVRAEKDAYEEMMSLGDGDDA